MYYFSLYMCVILRVYCGVALLVFVYLMFVMFVVDVDVVVVVVVVGVVAAIYCCSFYICVKLFEYC